MTAEIYFEKKLVYKELTDLGYKNVPNSQASQEYCGAIIKSDLKKYLNSVYSAQIKNLAKEHFKTEEAALNALVAYVCEEHVFKTHNVAIQMGKSFGFKGESFKLFQTNLSVANANDADTANVFSFVPQLNIDIAGIKKIPDIGIFVNGILFSIIELKFVNQGSTAKGGVDKFAQNLLEFSRQVEDKSKLFPYARAVHLVSMDSVDGFVCRNLSLELGVDSNKNELFSSAKNISLALKFKETISASFKRDVFALKKERREIGEFPGNAKFQYQAMMRALYSKQSIQNEIAHFNFLKQGSLTSPRPNQKYGVDLVLDLAKEMYKHEGEPNYNEISLRRKLALFPDLTEDRIAAELEKRKDFVNRKEFTLLLQYSAGFGKTFVLGWIASRLIEMQDTQGQFLFNKTLIVVDRLDLKDQMEIALKSQNISKAQYTAIDSKTDFKSAFESPACRIIIVNIQKFRDKEQLKDLFSVSGSDSKRTAILIDEIHRSNSGTLHNQMSNLFEDLSFFGDKSSAVRNLIVGVTATPQEEVLLKFGDIRYGTEGVYSVPHDIYSMKQSIQEGYTLNPLEHFIPLSLVMGLDNPEDASDVTDTQVYESESRIKANAEYIAETIIPKAFKAINGYGKAMLCCASITQAITYFNLLKSLLEPYTKSESGSRKRGVYIVYTKEQRYDDCFVLCDKSSEKEVIQEFRNSHNGLMIVVDKLQTGFDEPNLHTLIIDKPLSGINAVQTICRVNRTAPSKDSCYVYDLSRKNSAYKETIQAFNKYSDLVLTYETLAQYRASLVSEYAAVVGSTVYSKFYANFCKNKGDTALALAQYISDHKVDRAQELKKIKSDYRKYMVTLTKLLCLADGEVAEKYKDKNLLTFIKEVLNLLKGVAGGRGVAKPGEAPEFTIDGGIRVSPLFEGDAGTHITTSGPKSRDKSKTNNGSSAKERVDQFLKENEELEKYREQFLDILADFFNKLDELLNDYQKTNVRFRSGIKERLKGEISGETLISSFEEFLIEYLSSAIRKYSRENKEYHDVIRIYSKKYPEFFVLDFIESDWYFKVKEKN